MFGKICFAAGLAIMAHSATADVIDFTDAGVNGPFTGPAFSEGILTVTASPGDVYIDFFNGIGVSGGGSFALEIGEVLTFNFSQVVTNVLINRGNTINNGDIRFEGFLGAVSTGAGIYNEVVNSVDANGNFRVSDLIGEPITSLIITPLGGLSPVFMTTSITFDRVMPPIPLPAGGFLLAGAIAAAFGLRRRAAAAA